MPDSVLQAQLDPSGFGHGPRILRATSDLSGTKTDYLVHGGAQYAGRVRYCQCTSADTDNQKETAIRATLSA
jgi:hypothetical protein